jgi:hypothetical protein
MAQHTAAAAIHREEREEREEREGFWVHRRAAEDAEARWD